ncbi:MAG: hypothetical protein R3A46_08360 [Thermomicrobiales bacterium]
MKRLNAAGSLSGFERDAVFGAAGFRQLCWADPLHVWLPRAHPAALCRHLGDHVRRDGQDRYSWSAADAWDFSGTPSGWWGWLLILAGVISAVLGILYALDGA